MNRPVELRPHRFFMGTRALPCPYIPGRVERKVVTDLATPDAMKLYDNLSRAGFRRSHSLAYRPACPGCTACVPVRIRVEDFDWSRSFRRITNRNADLTTRDMAGHATMEQYRLFTRYQRSRHSGGEMSSMSFRDFRAMIEDSPIDTRIIEFRDPEGSLVAVMLADRQMDAMSAVYSLFDPELDKRSLGTYMVLWLIKQAEANDLPHVYLGYWIEESPKMSYKTRFRPLEGLTPDGWKTL
ncbi:MAG: arginyltransferase [Alphaproteobacteria bacterium]|jgi:arginyl-tRNA--protein-N-Asp/Glu arginylyltransferase